MNNRSVFNISVVEIILILLFMFITISIYQLNYKNNQITELTQTVEAEREIIKDISNKDCPKLENKIEDLVNLEKCKKANIALKNNNTGIDYIANKISKDIKNADLRKYSKEYESLKNEKVQLDEQIAKLKSNKLTINVLTQLNQQDKPLHQQIITLEEKVKDNYKNRMILVNKINKLKTNDEVKYILSRLDKNDDPIDEQISAIAKELEQLKHNNILGKNYNTSTNYILNNLKHDNKPIDQQIQALKQSLENKNLLREIENLKKQLANSLNTRNKDLDIRNMKEALNNLQDIKNNPSKPYDQNSKDILEKIGMKNQPLNKQINQLKNTLDKDRQLKKQNTNNLQPNDKILNNSNMQKALNNLNNIKNNPSTPYDTNSKDILKQLDMNNKPLNEQINTLKNKLDTDKQLKQKLANNLKMKNDNLDANDLEKALDNLNKIKNKDTNTYTPKSKDILKQLDMDNKPLNEQINTLKNKLDTDKQLKQKLANNLKIKNDNLDANDLEKALDNLNKIKNKDTNTYAPKSKDILKQLDMDNKPLNEQINTLKNKLDTDKQLKQKLANNLKIKNDNLDANDLEKALDNLNKIKNKDTNTYTPKSKDILKQLDMDNKPLNEQINTLKNKLETDKQLKQKLANNLKMKNDNLDTNDLEKQNKLKKQIKELEKLLDNKLVLNDPKINKENIEKALRDLNNSKKTNKAYRDKLNSALDAIKEIEKIKNKLSYKTDSKPILNKKIENAIKYLEDRAVNPNLKANKDVQKTLNEYNIKGKPTQKQLSNLYLNLYSTPTNNTNVSELNFIVKRLKNLRDLNDRVKYIDNFLEKTTYTNAMPSQRLDNISTKDDKETKEAKDGRKAKDDKEAKDGKDNYSKKEIATLKNKIKYLQKKIEKSGVTHLPCFIDDEGSSIFLFILYLRDNNIHVKLGEHESVKELSKGLPNMNKLVGKTMSLKKFMKLTKPIFEKTIQDECRHFVYFEDETVSKKEYKRKTLTIQHHFYKYIDHSW